MGSSSLSNIHTDHPLIAKLDLLAALKQRNSAMHEGLY